MAGNYKNWEQEDFTAAVDNHIELCDWLHNNSELLPQKVLDEIHDMMYMFYEPK